MNPIQGLQAGYSSLSSPGANAPDLLQRAQQNRFQFNLQNPSAMLSGPLPDPRWEMYFQAIDDASGGKGVKFGSAPGLPTDNNIATDPSSSFNTSTGPFGAFGAGTGGIDGQPPAAPSYPPNKNRLTERSAPLNGLYAAGR